MPELPEIETIKRGLETKIVGAQVTNLEVLTEKIAQFNPDDLQYVIGHEIISIRRRAKVPLIDMSSGYTIMFHLKMTGQIVFEQARGKRFSGGHPTNSMIAGLPDKSTRIVIELSNGKLYFNDQRKFGWMKILETSEVPKEPFMAKVGPEPLEGGFTVKYLDDITKRSSMAIKPFLLDQSRLAGLGNIYVDEALHYAKIHPLQSANTITKKQVEVLHEGIRFVLSESIEKGGTSFSSYVNHLGFYGDYLKSARVFKREGEVCNECGAIIEKKRVAGRGTHICPVCQVLII